MWVRVRMSITDRMELPFSSTTGSSAERPSALSTALKTFSMSVSISAAVGGAIVVLAIHLILFEMAENGQVKDCRRQGAIGRSPIIGGVGNGSAWLFSTRYPKIFDCGAPAVRNRAGRTAVAL